MTIGKMAWLGAVAGLLSTAAPVQAQMPRRVGVCTQATLKAVVNRWGDKLVKPKAGDIDQGSAFEASNGVLGISYSFDAALAESRVGDPVKTCLVSVPMGCPKGDSRGKIYTITNLRTQGSWTMPDAQHMCGGA